MIAKKWITGLVGVVSLTTSATFGATIFWADDGCVYRANEDGTNSVKVHDNARGTALWVVADSANQKLYARGRVGTNDGDGSIFRMDFDGNNLETLVSGLSIHGYGLGVDVLKERMYFENFATGAFFANLNGTGQTLMPYTTSGLDDLNHMHDFEIAAGKLYYTNAEHEPWKIGDVERFTGVRSSDLDGTNIKTVVDTPQDGGFVCIAIDEVHSKLYWSQDKQDSIYWSDLDGSNAKTFLSGIPAYDLEIDPYSQMLYFTTHEPGTSLYRVRLDGTDLEALATLTGDGVPGLALAFTQPVPEPTSLVLWSGLFVTGLIAAKRRKRLAMKA